MRIFKLLNTKTSADQFQSQNPVSSDFRINTNENPTNITDSKKSYLNGLMADLSGSYHGIDKAFQIIIWLLQNQEIMLIQDDGKKWQGSISGSKPCDQNGPEKNKMVFRLAEMGHGDIYHHIQNKLYFGWCIENNTKGLSKSYNIMAYLD